MKAEVNNLLTSRDARSWTHAKLLINVSRRKAPVCKLRLAFEFGLFYVRISVTVYASLRGRVWRAVYDLYYLHFFAQVIVKLSLVSPVTQAQAQTTYADAVTCCLLASFVLTIGTNDQTATESAYVACAYACVTSENQALARRMNDYFKKKFFS